MECLRDQFDAGVLLNNRYRTVSPLNHGSFGMVFLAEDITTGKQVAIKCVTKRSAAEGAGVDFAVDDNSEELVLHGRLTHHKNIVNLLESFETEAHTYIVLEYCEQGDLYEAIRVGHGPLETEHVRRFMFQLVDAVDYIHSKGVFHRDIKPENIFLAADGDMKLGDFGLATTDRWTYENTVGSDRYMSPEQYDSAGAGYSPAEADIWAVGICLLNILFSRNPFTTPSESDPLFQDFARDKQSLFDVFPSMSQDTYEVIVQCMSLDPNRRSLAAARHALRRVVSFTTLDDSDDDFCSAADRNTQATANREPLRTPSIQSPHVDSGAFPWSKALHAAKPIRTLSVIPDNESYTEDLFSKSEATTEWSSAQTPSIASMLDNSLPESMRSMAIRPKKNMLKNLPISGSLPINMAKPRITPAMSMVFGQTTMSKSWSDLWEEDAEEEERARQEINGMRNSRSWSHESKAVIEDNDDTPRGGLSPQVKSLVIDSNPRIVSLDDTFAGDIDGDAVTDGFFFHDFQSTPRKQEQDARYVTPNKPVILSDADKWSQLGERRRAFTRTPGEKRSYVRNQEYDSGLKPKVGSGLGFATMGYGVSGSPKAAAAPTLPTSLHQQPSQHNYVLNHQHHHFNNTQHHSSPLQKPRSTRDVGNVKACPWNEGRGWGAAWDWRGKDKRQDQASPVQWVDYWQKAHF